MVYSAPNLQFGITTLFGGFSFQTQVQPETIIIRRFKVKWIPGPRVDYFYIKPEDTALSISPSNARKDIIFVHNDNERNPETSLKKKFLEQAKKKMKIHGFSNEKCECQIENLKFLNIFEREQKRCLNNFKGQREREDNITIDLQEYASKFCDLTDEKIGEVFDGLTNPSDNIEDDTEEEKKENNCIKQRAKNHQNTRGCIEILKSADEKVRKIMIDWFNQQLNLKEETNDEILECMRKAITISDLNVIYKTVANAHERNSNVTQNSSKKRDFISQISLLVKHFRKCYIKDYENRKIH